MPYIGIFTYLREASALLVLPSKAMREPLKAERATGIGSRAFFIYLRFILMLWRAEHRSQNHIIMLKRFLTVLICLPFAITAFAAQLTATLQSGDTFTPFYGENAFVEAYNAAADGDIITLSPGSFKTTEIKKGITLIGTYAFSTDTSEATVLSTLTVSGNNVTLEGLRISGSLNISGADNLSINRSSLYKVTDSENGEKKYHDNTVLSDCIVYEYAAMSLSQNAVFRNCCIDSFSDINETAYPALIENCNIPLFKYYQNDDVTQPYAVYRKCFLGLYKYNSNQDTPYLNLYSPTELDDIIFYFNYRTAGSNVYAKSWVIDFHSCIRNNVNLGQKLYDVAPQSPKNMASFSSYTYDGLTVGPSDVKEYPAIPVITDSQIDSKTDEEGNLHVKISATARD